MIWVKKYVQLIEYEESKISHLNIYDSELDVGSGQPKNIIVIDQHTSVQPTEAIDEERFCLMIYKDLKDSVILAFDSFVERIDWELTLNHVINNVKSALLAESQYLIPIRGVKQEIAEGHQIKAKRIYEGEYFNEFI